MFIIDGPYISDVTEQFLVDAQIPILENDFASERIRSEANFITDSEAVKQLQRDDFKWLYTNSENAIAWLAKTFGKESSLLEKIDVFKNKSKFREATAELFPQVTFKKVSAEDIDSLNFSDIGCPFIIKPNVGFISAGVYRVNDETEWRLVQKKILSATAETAAAFPDEVLSGDAFIIESIIEGEEYAVDAYFDEQNNPVVLNILHHRFSGKQDMSDRLYVTSAKIITEQIESIKQFLSNVASVDDFRGMPVHAEVRIDDEGLVLPIEINPLRFAGWCSTDIAHYAYGVNVYDYFIKQKKPDWKTILKGKETETYAMGVIERGEALAGDQKFDYEAFKKQFSSLITLRKMDYGTFPLFAFVFFKVIPETEGELEMALTMNPREFVCNSL